MPGTGFYVVTGITVEKRNLKLPEGAVVGDPECEDDPDDCCGGSGSGSGGSGGGGSGGGSGSSGSGGSGGGPSGTPFEACCGGTIPDDIVATLTNPGEPCDGVTINLTRLTATSWNLNSSSGNITFALLSCDPDATSFAGAFTITLVSGVANVTGPVPSTSGSCGPFSASFTVTFSDGGEPAACVGVYVVTVTA